MKDDNFPIDEQVALLLQGTEYGDDNLRLTVENELKERLVEVQREGRSLRVYCGFDPRTSDLHLGHTVPMRKLRQFQELGHSVTFLIGTYTSLIGDPSDKDKLRPQLSPEEVINNAKTYAEQAFKILDPNLTIIRYNSDWLASLSFADLIKLGSNFTLQQFITRENFRKRWDRGEAIFLHETFYSLMQGFDAHALQADVQVGGTDQLFNIVTAARKIMSYFGDKPNIPIILGILPGTDGEVKMSKSLGNHIPLLSTPEDMYGKVMSIPDKAMGQFFRLVSRFTPEEIRQIEYGLKEGIYHPRDVKMMLAKEIVSIYHSEEAAIQAQENFVRVFQQHEIPEVKQEIRIKPGQSVVEIMVEGNIALSKSQAKRLIEQKGVHFQGKTISDPNMIISETGILQVGKRKFVKLII
jgi:tyrosyl-tRNA synthetase